MAWCPSYTSVMSATQRHVVALARTIVCGAVQSRWILRTAADGRATAAADTLKRDIEREWTDRTTRKTVLYSARLYACLAIILSLVWPEFATDCRSSQLMAQNAGSGQLGHARFKLAANSPISLDLKKH